MKRQPLPRIALVAPSVLPLLDGGHVTFGKAPGRPDMVAMMLHQPTGCLVVYLTADEARKAARALDRQAEGAL